MKPLSWSGINKPFFWKLIVAFAVIGSTSLAARSGVAPFLKESNAAMSKMMVAMDIVPTGDVDKDFVAMMTPHHQGAIAMAKSLLRYGKNEQLKRLAQEIIITQQQEIAVMQLALDAHLTHAIDSPSQPSAVPTVHENDASPHDAMRMSPPIMTRKRGSSHEK